MNGKLWQEALGRLDDELVDEYYEQKEKINTKRSIRRVLVRAGAMTACLALAVTVSLAISHSKPTGGADTESNIQPIPSYPNAVYTAEDAARAFSGRYYASAQTPFYETERVIDAESLHIGGIPDSEYLAVYSRNDMTAPIDELEFADFLDGILARCADITGNEAPDNGYEFKASEYVDDEAVSLRTTVELGGVSLQAEQSTCGYRVDVYGCAELIHSAQLLSEPEKVAETLAAVRDAAGALFGVSFSDPAVSSYYDPTDGQVCCIVQYGNADGTDDGLRIVLDMGKPQDVRVIYTSSRGRAEDRYKVTGEAKMISFEDAEALLYNGYVFGGHICGFCASQQESVDFRGYDYAGFEYVYSYGSPAEEHVGFPFYTFYKKLENDSVGNEVYAKTYVPAIELGGYEEYFESRSKLHENSPYNSN